MTEGVSAALAAVLDGELEGKAAAEALEQAGLFEDMDPAEIGDLDAPSPFSHRVEHPLAEAVRTRRRGRPAGAKNRRTEATVRWLLLQHRHPLAVMMEAYSMAPADLAERIGLSKARRTVKERREVAGGIVEVEVEVQEDYFANDVLLEVVKLQIRMAEAVAPYVAQRLPQAVKIEGGGGDFHLHVGGVSFPARGAEPENSGPIEGQFRVALPPKSDE